MDAPEAAAVIERPRSHPHWEFVDYPGGLMKEEGSASTRAGLARRQLPEV